MSDRYVTMDDVDSAISEKVEFYKEWLGKGLITENEYEDHVRILGSVRTSIRFRSKLPTYINKDILDKDKEAI